MSTNNYTALTLTYPSLPSRLLLDRQHADDAAHSVENHKAVRLLLHDAVDRDASRAVEANRADALLAAREAPIAEERDHAVLELEAVSLPYF